MTIERAWVRVLLSTPWRVLATVVGLFVLIVVAPVVLFVVGLGIVGVVVLLVGLAAAVSLGAAMLPGGSR